MKTWRFEALDTLFFRESRPMESVGGSELSSLFPPPAGTVAGAVRTAMGNALGVDWDAFKERDDYRVDGLHVREQMGVGKDLGRLRLSGPWLFHDGERLYPMPMDLLGRYEGGELKKIVNLRIGKPTHSDLGQKIRLPELPKGLEGSKPLEQAWIAGSVLEHYLAGCALKPDMVLFGKQLFRREARLGIARDNRKNVVEKGMLYQTSHIRLGPNTSIEIDLSGVDPRMLNADGLIRLGGEGRLAGIQSIPDKTRKPASPRVKKNTYGIKIVLLTPALFAWDFARNRAQLTAEESGTIIQAYASSHGIELTLCSAVVGKAQREGGWDLIKKAPHPVQSLIPAGSIYYCKVDSGDIQQAIDKLHLTQMGAQTELGRGVVAIGLWNKNEIVEA